ncbi:hypothetical protein PMZ80_005604 [Knufia obscura]|uniref:Uncharacterized protein n=1 Tax=Knufia obscura TaxID=1635080 RepID=A0ABR0RM22_9EURO|nr:hypothetical protein PMZ80_005604 [Knufia obscura]
MLLSRVSPHDLSHGPVSAIHTELWSALSTCPTTHYAVIVQPGVTPADYETSWLPVGAGIRTALIASDIQGKVDITAVINTILMDCLHHGVTRVETLDTKGPLPELSSSVVRESVIYAVLPGVEAGSQKRRDVLIDQRHRYVEGLVGKYFDNRDYTIVYVTEGRVDGETKGEVEEKVHGLGAEVPFVLEEK